MRRHSFNPDPKPHAGGRAGATLTEVLIALLAMGIGVVAVATMFPISLLKAVKATQLTHAAIARYNAEAIIESDQGVYAAIHDPPSLGAATRNPVKYPQPLTDPAVYEHGGQRYVVDPLGAVNANSPAPAFVFGHNGSGGTVAGASMTRLNAGRMTLQAAEQVAMSPDEWQTLADDEPVAVINDNDLTTWDTITVSSAVDVSLITTLSGTNNPPTRVILFGAVLNGSNLENKLLVRQVQSKSGQALTLTPSLPINYQVERLRIEQQDQQFTWLWTVRKDGSGAQASVDVVVFFRRSFDPAEERLYSAHWQNLQVAGRGTTAGPQVTVMWGTAPKPFYKKSGFIFDAEQAQWYRIQDILAETATSVTFKLDRRVPSFYDRQASPNGSAMLMKGIVDVYPIGTKSIE